MCSISVKKNPQNLNIFLFQHHIVYFLIFLIFYLTFQLNTSKNDTIYLSSIDYFVCNMISTLFDGNIPVPRYSGLKDTYRVKVQIVGSPVIER